MINEITLTLPDKLYRSAERMALGAKRPLPRAITEVLTEALLAWEEPEQDISSISDEEVLTMCGLEMTAVQSNRLSTLLDKQREGELSSDERPELWALMRVYERALLHRSDALVEAVKRDLLEPLQGQ
jgi:hypothetical protein